eukprot:1106540-Rhodomonas_salina.2
MRRTCAGLSGRLWRRCLRSCALSSGPATTRHRPRCKHNQTKASAEVRRHECRPRCNATGTLFASESGPNGLGFSVLGLGPRCGPTNAFLSNKSLAEKCSLVVPFLYHHLLRSFRLHLPLSLSSPYPPKLESLKPKPLPLTAEP